MGKKPKEKTEQNNAEKIKEGKDNNLKGNWGEQYIASELASQGCYIRHVMEGHDTGVDLYCEATDKDLNPFLHFWCQVKTSKDFTPDKDQETCSEVRQHADYWLAQPVPVFLFLVPDKRGENPSYHICRAIDLHQCNKASLISFHKIRSDKRKKDLRYFLDNHLPRETCKWALKDGKIDYIRKSAEAEYVVTFVSGFTGGFEDVVLRNVTLGLWRLVQDGLHNEKIGATISHLDTDKKIKLERFKNLSDAIEPLLREDPNHYENYATVGRVSHLYEDYDKANEYYTTALDMLTGDKKMDKNSEEYKDAVKGLTEYLEEVERAKKGGSPSPSKADDVSDYIWEAPLTTVHAGTAHRYEINGESEDLSDETRD